MAYISQDEKRALAPTIKAILKKYNMKGSIGIKNYSTLFVNLQSGAIDFGCDHRQVNEYHLEQSYTGDALSFLTELAAAMRGEGWFNHSDSMTDYFHIKHYISINIGKWNQPYVCTAAAVAN